MLAAPAILVASVWWKTSHQPWTQAPPNWKSGPPRVALSSWHVVPVRPVDAARGLTASIECEMWLLGSAPAGPGIRVTEPFLGTSEVPSLFYRRGHKVHRLLLPGADCGVRMERRHDTEARSAKGNPEFPPTRRIGVRLLLPVASLPADAQDVELRGRLSAGWIGKSQTAQLPVALRPLGQSMGSGYWKFKVHSGPFAVKLATLPRWTAMPGTIAEALAKAEIQVVRVQVQNISRDEGGDAEPGDALLQLHLRVPQPLLSRRRKHPRIIESKITDGRGRIYYPARKELSTISPNVFHSSFQIVGDARPGDFYLRENIPLWKVPASAGPLKLTMWVSTGDDDWPLFIECTARPAWLTRRAHTIEVESVKFSKIKGGEDEFGQYRAHGYSNVVDVTLHYRGTKIAMMRGYIKLGIERSPRWEPYSYYQDAQSLPYGAVSPVRPGPQNAEIVPDWSQRLTDAHGRFLPGDSPGGLGGRTVIRVEQPHNSADRKRWKVRYVIKRWPKTKEPLWFRADIGIAGEGFVPVSCRVDLP